MKKLFTLVAVALMAVGASAQTTLVDFSQKIGTITLSGTCEETTVKLHENKDATPCLKFNNGYTTDDVINKNYIMISTDGGFKAGDVITIAGAINNSDNSEAKRGAIDIFTGEDGGKETVLFSTPDFINGRFVVDDPAEISYTLEADYASLKLGRNGNTGTNVTVLKVVRGGSTGINSVNVEKENANAPMYNLAGQRVNNNAKGIVIQNGKKFIKK